MQRTGFSRRCKLALGCAILLATQACAMPPRTACGAAPADHVPKLDKTLNLTTVVRLLTGYHNDYYAADQAAVFTVAEIYVNGRLGKVANPVVVLDIDETSLDNYEALAANQFAFFPRPRSAELRCRRTRPAASSNGSGRRGLRRFRRRSAFSMQ